MLFNPFEMFFNKLFIIKLFSPFFSVNASILTISFAIRLHINVFIIKRANNIFMILNISKYFF
jgi:hypothetical protein